jgi:hypothetical protein
VIEAKSRIYRQSKARSQSLMDLRCATTVMHGPSRAALPAALFAAQPQIHPPVTTLGPAQAPTIDRAPRTEHKDASCSTFCYGVFVTRKGHRFAGAILLLIANACGGESRNWAVLEKEIVVDAAPVIAQRVGDSVVLEFTLSQFTGGKEACDDPVASVSEVRSSGDSISVVAQWSRRGCGNAKFVRYKIRVRRADDAPFVFRYEPAAEGGQQKFTVDGSRVTALSDAR